MSSKPFIGIGPHFFDIKGKPPVIGTYRTYVNAVERAGGVAVVLTPNADLANFYLKSLDGLLLTGGGDIHPKHFGAKLPKMKLDLSPEERTSFELRMARGFLKAKRPVLGICLGCQTINVVLGGTLIQDLPTEKPHTRDHTEGNHRIFLNKGTRLRKLVGQESLHVNSRHHQAISKLGRGLVSAAWSTDGVIEAIESNNHSFVFGLQWHPETIASKPESMKIFKAFVEACRK
jgi:putative glutamine amidotransferase